MQWSVDIEIKILMKMILLMKLNKILAKLILDYHFSSNLTL